MDGLFLQTVEGLGEPRGRTGWEIWEWLEDEKEDVAKEILSEGPVCDLAVTGVPEAEVSDESNREIEWHFRSHLEARLRELKEAEDRLLTGAYGHCEECGMEIDKRHLAADPAALCVLPVRSAANLKSNSARCKFLADQIGDSETVAN